VLGAIDGLGRVVLLTVQSLSWLVRPPFRISQVLSAMEFVGVQSIFIIMLTGTFSGMVFALQTVSGLRAYGAEGVVGSVVAVSLTREISPVFTALMVTAPSPQSSATCASPSRSTP
jgi:phospholipid/cholesterol/gamma-HCH transport system permease protein